LPEGFVPPCNPDRLRLVGLTVNPAWTVSVTATVSVAEPAPELTMVIAPWYVPAPRPLEFTETLTTPGIVPEPGLAVSQLAFGVAVKLRPEVDDDRVMLCGDGEDPPNVAETLVLVGFA
jgi:hypothetical protein